MQGGDWGYVMKKIMLLLLIGLLIPSAYSVVLEVNEGEFIKLNIEAVDADLDVINYTFSAPFDGKGEWLTTYKDAGNYTVYVTAYDGINQATEVVTLIVHNVNQAPALDVPDIEVNEGEVAALLAEVSDIDNDIIAISYPAPFDSNGEWHTGFDDAGDYQVTVSASDGKLTTKKTVNITVNDVNQLPVVAIKPGSSVQINETGTVVLEIDAYDPDGDSLAYSWYREGEVISEKKDFAFVTDFQSSGTYNFLAAVYDKEGKVEVPVEVVVSNVNRVPLINISDMFVIKETETIVLDLPEKDADSQQITYQISDPVGNDMVWETTYDDAGEYEIQIIADDSETTVTKTLKIIVEDVDRAPEAANLEIDAVEDEELRIELSASDPDKDAIIYTVLDGPENMTINNNILTWTPGYDEVQENYNWFTKLLFNCGILNLDHNKSKTVNALINAQGRMESSNISIKITVWNVNRAPVIMPIDDIGTDETELIRLAPNITDPDGDPFKVSYTGLMSSDSYRTTYDDAGDHYVLIYATDGKAETEQNISVKINNRNREPELATKEVLFAENITTAARLYACDADGSNVKIKQVTIPEGSEFRDNELVWKPDFELVEHSALGWFDRLKASLFGYSKEITGTVQLDDGEIKVERNFTIVVQDVNRPPVLDEIKPITVTEDEKLEIPVSAKDPDGDELRISFSGLVSENNQTISFEDAGKHDVTVTVTDGEWKRSRTFPVTVTETNRPPVLDVGKVRVSENETLYLELKGKDPENNLISYSIVEGPDGAVIQGNVLTWTPPYNTIVHDGSPAPSSLLSSLVGRQIVAEVPFRILVDDGQNSSVANFTIEVADVNRKPVIVEQSPFQEFTTFSGNIVNFTVVAVDPDGDSLQYEWKLGTFETEKGTSTHLRKVINPGIKEMILYVSDGNLVTEVKWKYAVNKIMYQETLEGAAHLSS
jgi:hypothetical protein